MDTTELTTGTLEYRDTGGDGPTIVLLHGLMMDSTLWDGPVAALAADHRCVVPTLPLGAHRVAAPASDVSLTGVAVMVAEFLEHLDLRDVTLVGNDTGGAVVQLMLGDLTDRVARVVLVACETEGNYPARVTGSTLALTGKLPPWAFGLFMQQMRLRLARRLPIAFGWLTKRGDATVAAWMRPVLTRPEIRRDAVRTLRAAKADARRLREIPDFHRPALVVWAAGDRVMPAAHGRRLAERLGAKLVEVDDSYTLIPLDQPAELAGLLRDFVSATR